jgi:hypothetical protein
MIEKSIVIAFIFIPVRFPLLPWSDDRSHGAVIRFSKQRLLASSKVQKQPSLVSVRGRRVRD